MVRNNTIFTASKDENNTDENKFSDLDAAQTAYDTLVAQIKEKRAELNKKKRSLQKKNKTLKLTGTRKAPCIVCVNSCAAGKSDGDCLDIESNGTRCAHCDKGGKVCSKVPLVLLPFALHLLKTEMGTSARTHATSA